MYIASTYSPSIPSCLAATYIEPPKKPPTQLDCQRPTNGRTAGAPVASSGGGSTSATTLSSVRNSTASIWPPTNLGKLRACSIREISSAVLTKPMVSLPPPGGLRSRYSAPISSCRKDRGSLGGDP